MKDLFGNENISTPVSVNIYADEIQSKNYPYNNDIWHYIGLVVEDFNNPLLKDIIDERFCGNFDKESKYFNKNNKVIHWADIRNADQKNICKRWFEYILNPSKSQKGFYSYILGINDSKLIKEEFDSKDDFNSKYNRFFRSAVLYALKTFFSNKKIIVKNIFHEVGQQQENQYFPWHCICKLEEENITFECREITFLPKDHKKDKKSNLIQLCDCILGASTSIIHGVEKSAKSNYRETLMDLYSPLFQRIINRPKNKNSSYKYYNRIIIRFFPKEKTSLGDRKRYLNQFYIERTLYYIEQKSGQQYLF